MRLFSLLFWGVFLFASGAVLLLKYMLNLNHVSGGKLIFGLFVLLVGVSMLTGNIGWRPFDSGDDNVTLFSGSRQVTALKSNDYTVIFGSTDYDLSEVEPGSRVKVNCIFGSSRLKLPAGAVDVSADCAFGSVNMPNGSINFGNLPYSRGEGTKTRIEVSCVFGSVSVVE